ncbi:MAG: hypothetical protein Q9167_000831 [Letrouitia subvulpina]
MPVEKDQDEEFTKDVVDMLIRASQTLEANQDDETIDERDALEMEEDANPFAHQSPPIDEVFESENLSKEEKIQEFRKFLQAGGLITGGDRRDDPYNPKSQNKCTGASKTKPRKPKGKKQTDADVDDDDAAKKGEVKPPPPKKTPAKGSKGKTHTAANESKDAHLHVPPKTNPKKRKQSHEDSSAGRLPPLPYPVYQPALPPAQNSLAVLADAATAHDSSPPRNSTSRPNSRPCRLRLTPPRGPKDLAKWRMERENNNAPVTADDPAPFRSNNSSRPKRRSNRLPLTPPR